MLKQILALTSGFTPDKKGATCTEVVWVAGL
jgi:hypothetical protein